MARSDRTAGQMGRVFELLDGVRTANDIASLLGVKPEYVRATVARQGWQDRLRAGRPGAPAGPVEVLARAALPVDDGPSRAEDERLLGWVRDRVAETTIADIARRDRVGASFVQMQTSAVRDADIVESGEPPLAVDRAYAWRRK